jgi:hypothetical protein
MGQALAVPVEGGGMAKTVGPISLHGVSFNDALASLAPEQSFIIERTGATKIKRIILIATASPTASPTDNFAIANASSDPASSGDAGAADQQTAAMQAAARNRLAISMRDVVKLSYAKDKQSVEKLENIARNADDPMVRVAALSSLSQSSDVGAVSFLKSRLLGDPDPAMRLAAAQALVQVDQKQSKRLIEEAAKREPDPELRTQLEEIAGY